MSANCISRAYPHKYMVLVRWWLIAQRRYFPCSSQFFFFYISIPMIRCAFYLSSLSNIYTISMEYTQFWSKLFIIICMYNITLIFSFSLTNSSFFFIGILHFHCICLISQLHIFVNSIWISLTKLALRSYCLSRSAF